MTTRTQSPRTPKTPPPAAKAELSLPEQIEQRVDCADLAQRLGLERRGERGLFKNPRAKGMEYSISCRPKDGDSGSTWECLDRQVSGGPIELVCHVRDLDGEREWPEAVWTIMELYGWADGESLDPEQTQAGLIAERSLRVARADAEQRAALLAWLEAQHGIPAHIALRAIDAGVLGLNDYRNPRHAEGQMFHGGPAAALVALQPETTNPVAVDLHYLDPAKNGGKAETSHRSEDGALWCMDWQRFKKARKVIVLASPLEALAVECCTLPGGTVAVATMGLWGARCVDWRRLLGKQVVIAFCPGKPAEMGPGKGYCAGARAAWRVHEALVGLDVPALMLDMGDWREDAEDKDSEPFGSVTEALKAWGADKLAGMLRRLEPWLIPGMPAEQKRGHSRVWLPFHDNQVYWRYRVKEDFTQFVSRYEPQKDAEGKPIPGTIGELSYESVAGFRVAAVSRVTIASPTSTMTGDADTSPHTIFAISVQVPRHERLLRRVVTDEALHNVEVWKKLGPVFAPQSFLRMVNILERAVSIGERSAVNFVGLAWRDGRLVVNDGASCYFTQPDKQCPYSNLVFPSGPRSTARRVVQAYQTTFRRNGVLQMLVWALGAHLKVFLGFWPHFVMQADKGTGKDTILKRMERSIGMTVFSRQSMQTEFRILTSVSYTSHPVGWGELSANKQDLINKALHNLQEAYQYSVTKRGAEMTDYLICAPVLLAGEDVPVDTLHGKVVRNHLELVDQGPLMPEDLPVFPVRQWLEFLAGLDKGEVQKQHRACVEQLAKICAGNTEDAGAKRMLNNYGGVLCAWKLLAEFAQIDPEQGGFVGDLAGEMNSHIRESEGERQPWVWIVDTLLSEIARGTFRYPYSYTETEDEEKVLAVRTSHVMDHIAREPSLRDLWDRLPVKSDRVFKRQLRTANVLTEGELERTINGKRVAHLVGLSLSAIEQYGLYAAPPVARLDEPDGENGYAYRK